MQQVLLLKSHNDNSGNKGRNENKHRSRDAQTMSFYCFVEKSKQRESLLQNLLILRKFNYKILIKQKTKIIKKQWPNEIHSTLIESFQTPQEERTRDKRNVTKHKQKKRSEVAKRGTGSKYILQEEEWSTARKERLVGEFVLLMLGERRGRR